MKKLLLVAVVAICMVSVAQADSGWGPTISYWDAGDWGDGVGIGVKFSIEVMEGISFDSRLTWYDDLEGEVESLSTSVQATPLEFGICAKLPTQRIEAYVGGGIGYYFLGGDIYTPAGGKVDADMDDELGYYINIAVEIPLSVDTTQYMVTRTTIFLEALYRIVDVKDITIDDDRTYRVTEDLSGYSLQGGVMLRW
jgi:hypothetical protein